MQVVQRAADAEVRRSLARRRKAGTGIVTQVALAAIVAVLLSVGLTAATGARAQAPSETSREIVQQVQTALAARGYDPGPTDGLMGARTIRAIRLYQAQAGLRVDGKATQGLANHLRRETVKKVQRMLAERGYDAGSADGFAGRKTRTAIRRYQEQAGLNVDGEATDALVDHMLRETVRTVQRMLAVLGYDVGVVDGLAGDKTTIAIRTYQERHGLEVDGKASQDLVNHATRETIKSAQRLLAARGYDPGPADGYPGRKTTAAIRDYQTRAGLPVDGKVSLILIEHLNASAGISARNAPYAGPGDVVIGYQRDEFAPVYEVSDVFAYTDGRVETVLRVGSDRVWWRTRDGDSQTSHRNFILPRIAWQTPAGTGEATVDLDVDDAWPSAQGKTVSFGVSVFWTPVDTPGTAIKTTETWGCRRKLRERVSVAAGTFETIPVVCRRSNPPSGGWSKRVWYYAPAVRHYVRRDDHLDGVDAVHRVELVAIRPGRHDWPSAVRAGLEQGIQHLLENGGTGTETHWASTAVGEAFDIKMTGDIERPDGVTCRTFVLVRSQAINPRAYPAVACRGGNEGPWLVPVLDQDKGAVGPLSAS